MAGCRQPHDPTPIFSRKLRLPIASQFPTVSKSLTVPKSATRPRFRGACSMENEQSAIVGEAHKRLIQPDKAF